MYPDTAPVTPHPQLGLVVQDTKTPLCTPDAEGPLVEDQTLHPNLAYLLDMLKATAAWAWARALHGLDDQGIRGDLTRWTDWTKCITSLVALECHLGDYCDSNIWNSR